MDKKWNNDSIEILIVEDEMITAKAIATLLKRIHYKPTQIFTSGEECLEYLQTNSAGLILMDIYLEGELNGIQTAQTITQKYQIPIIFISAYSDLETIKQACSSEPYGYLVKPITNEEDILPTLELALHNHPIKAQLIEQQSVYRQIENLVLGGRELVNPPKNLKPENAEIDPIRLALYFNALGNEDRFHIFAQLSQDAMISQEIQNFVEKAQSTISHHIKKLEKANLIRGLKKGKYTAYSVDKNGFQGLLYEINLISNRFKQFEEIFRKIDPQQISNPIHQPDCDYSTLEALGNEERLGIIAELLKTPKTTSDLEEILNKPQSSISYQIKTLEDAGIIIGSKTGKFTTYEINLSKIEQIFECFYQIYHNTTNFA